MNPYYESDTITIYHGDALQFTDHGPPPGLVMVTDPPYGIDYKSGKEGALPRSIHGDSDTWPRDAMLQRWGDNPAIVFGSWRAPRPVGTRALLVWDTGGALGMGALDLPWKPAHQEIYVLGRGFTGKRTSDVLRFPPVQAMASNGRVHPHEKPVPLMSALLAKCPPGLIFDPFMGSGSTLIAASKAGREAVGIEVDERFCEIAAKRLAQGVLNLV